MLFQFLLQWNFPCSSQLCSYLDLLTFHHVSLVLREWFQEMTLVQIVILINPKV
jgi:hypothetical protein